MMQHKTINTTIENTLPNTPSITKKTEGHILHNVDLSIGTHDLFIPNQLFGRKTDKSVEFEELWNYNKDDMTVASIETIYAIMQHIAAVKENTGEIFPELTTQNKSFIWQQSTMMASRVTYNGKTGTIEHKNPDGTTTTTVTPIPEYTPIGAFLPSTNQQKVTKLTLVRSTSDRSYLTENIAEATEQLVRATLGKHYQQYVEILRRGIHNFGAEINLYTPSLESRDSNQKHSIKVCRKSPSAQIDIGYELAVKPEKYAYQVQLVR